MLDRIDAVVEIMRLIHKAAKLLIDHNDALAAEVEHYKSALREIASYRNTLGGTCDRLASVAEKALDYQKEHANGKA